MKTSEKVLPLQKKAPKQPITIFLVEDDKLYLHAVGFNLNKRKEYKIFCYSSGEDCLKNMSLNPDIVILDYYLNETNPESLDGLTVLLEIKKIKPSTIVIMLSSQKNLTVAMRTLKAEAYTYLIKNKQTLSQLNEVIDQVVNNIGLGNK
ncbi:MAG: response regulator [Bacteroidota bacterium]